MLRLRRKSQRDHVTFFLRDLRQVAFRGMRLLSGAQIRSLSGDGMWFLADAIILSCIVSMLGIFCVSCFLIDSRGPFDWTIYNVRNNIPGQPMLRDLAGVCMAQLHFGAIVFFGLHPGIMLWHFAAILTVFHSSFVSCVVEKLAPPSSAAQTLKAARAWPVVVFGLRYGLLAAMCDFAPSVNAVVTLRLLRKMDVASPKVTVEETECFLPHFGAGLLVVVAGLATASGYASELDTVSWRAILLDWAFSLATLVYANALVLLLDAAGDIFGDFHMGNRILAQSQQQAPDAGLPFIKPTMIGCSVCGVCSFLMLFIAAG